MDVKQATEHDSTFQTKKAALIPCWHPYVGPPPDLSGFRLEISGFQFGEDGRPLGYLRAVRGYSNVRQPVITVSRQAGVFVYENMGIQGTLLRDNGRSACKGYSRAIPVR
jgi:hypothetical protein